MNVYDVRRKGEKWRRLEAPDVQTAAATYAEKPEEYLDAQEVEVRQIGSRTIITVTVETYYQVVVR